MKQTFRWFFVALFFVLLLVFPVHAEPELAPEPVPILPLDFREVTENRTAEGWSWNAQSRILSVQDFDFVVEDADAVLLPANSTLRFSGKCSIQSKEGSALVTDGFLTIVGTGELSLSGTVHGVNGPDTVLMANGVTVTGTKGAAAGLIETDGGFQMTVSNGKEFKDELYDGHRTVRTGVLYPVYVTVSRGGGAFFYTGMFAPGEKVVITARAQYGYRFVQWSSPYVTIEDPEAIQFTFTMPEKPVRIYGDFERAYSVTIPEDVEGGHVEFITEGGRFFPGKQVILYAVPDTGYYFSHWESDYGRFRDPLQAYAALTMPSIDVVATPVFVKGESYYLKVETIGEGETNVLVGNFPENKSVLLRAKAAEGYVFSGWMSDAGHFLSSTEEQTYFTMPAQNVTVTAVFTLTEEYKKTLTIEPTIGGTLNVTGGLYAPGMPISLKAEPKVGYRFVKWTITPEKYASALLDGNFAQTEFIMPAEDVSISARFELLDPEAVTFYLSVVEEYEGGTVISSEPSGNYLAGYEIDLSAEPAEGYYFAGWESALGGKFENKIDRNTIFYMPANDTRISAVFSKIIDPADQKPPEEAPPLDPSDIGGIDKEYLSFGISLALCGGLAAGGTIYAEISRKASGGTVTRRRKHRRKLDVKKLRAKK